MTLEEVKYALRIEHDFDNAWLNILHQSAQDYIMDSITLSDKRDAYFANNPKFNTAVLFLLGHWYESRIAATDKALIEIPHGVTHIIQQLRAGYIDEV